MTLTPTTAGYAILGLIWGAMLVDIAFGFPVSRWLLDLDRRGDK